MSFGPSSLCLSNQTDIYSYAPVYDADGGVISSQSYPSSPTFPAVGCSVQAKQLRRVDDMGRVSTFIGYYVEFGPPFPYALKVNDQLVWNGLKLYVDGVIDGAGRGRSFRVQCSERI